MTLQAGLATVDRSSIPKAFLRFRACTDECDEWDESEECEYCEIESASRVRSGGIDGVGASLDDEEASNGRDVEDRSCEKADAMLPRREKLRVWQRSRSLTVSRMHQSYSVQPQSCRRGSSQIHRRRRTCIAIPQNSCKKA